MPDVGHALACPVACGACPSEQSVQSWEGRAKRKACLKAASSPETPGPASLFSVASVTSVISKLREDEAPAPDRRAHSQGLLCTTNSHNLRKPRQFPDKRYLRLAAPAHPSALSATSALSGFDFNLFSLRLSVSAVNILWLRRRRAVSPCLCGEPSCQRLPDSPGPRPARRSV